MITDAEYKNIIAGAPVVEDLTGLKEVDLSDLIAEIEAEEEILKLLEQAKQRAAALGLDFSASLDGQII